MGQGFSDSDDRDDDDTKFIMRYQGDPIKMVREMNASKAESIRQRISNHQIVSSFCKLFIVSVSSHGTLEKLPKTVSLNYKAIFVEYDSNTHVEIIVMENEEDLTIGWLMSETLRKVNKSLEERGLPRDTSSMICLKTKEKLYAIDYLLSNLDRPVSILKDRTTLVPFFADEKYEVKDQKISIDYFIILKLIGEGGFSKVYMARRKDNGQFYAIKVISKPEMIKRGKMESIFREKDFMTAMEHPYIVKLHFAFQTDENLFLVMDFLPGGELFYHIQKRRMFSEQQAKVYAAEIILGLSYLHKNDIIYRDLKPENILVDIDGHLHLADFGLCKEVTSKNELNYSFCGSPEYMAPEVITKKGYNFMVDYYALGVLVYELVVGSPPFIRTTNTDLFHKIVTREVYLPGHLSSKCKDFLSALLVKDPKKRLGAKDGMSEIINHPWMRELNYGEIILKKVQVPVKPDPYNLNFHEDFLKVRTSNCDLSAELKKQLSPKKSQQPIPRFDNFSFYSNIQTQNPKYIDTLFLDLEVLPDQTKMTTQGGGLRNSENEQRLRKLFESKGLTGVSTPERGSIISSVSSSARQSLLKGPKLDMIDSPLRIELFNTGTEEEKSDLDVNINYHIDRANLQQLNHKQLAPKLKYDLESSPRTPKKILSTDSDAKPRFSKVNHTIVYNPTEMHRNSSPIIRGSPTRSANLKFMTIVPTSGNKRDLADPNNRFGGTEEAEGEEGLRISKTSLNGNDFRVKLEDLNSAQILRTLPAEGVDDFYRKKVHGNTFSPSSRLSEQGKASRWMQESNLGGNSTSDIKLKKDYYLNTEITKSSSDHFSSNQSPLLLKDLFSKEALSRLQPLHRANSDHLQENNDRPPGHHYQKSLFSTKK